MRLGDLELTPGETFDHKGLQKRFDRGMTGRGIEICYDEDDQRYLRLFSSDEGPYDDDVRGGQFTYIGEGLSGDQKHKRGIVTLSNLSILRFQSFSFIVRAENAIGSIKAKSKLLTTSTFGRPRTSGWFADFYSNDATKGEKRSIRARECPISPGQNGRR